MNWRIHTTSAPILVSPVVNNKTSSFLPPTGSLRVAGRLEISAEGEILSEADRLMVNAIADANRSPFRIAPTLNVPRNPQTSIRSRGTLAPTTAPRTFAR